MRPAPEPGLGGAADALGDASPAGAGAASSLLLQAARTQTAATARATAVDGRPAVTAPFRPSSRRGSRGERPGNTMPRLLSDTDVSGRQVHCLGGCRARIDGERV